MRILEKLKRTPRLGFANAAGMGGGLPPAGRHGSVANPVIWPAAGLGRISGNASVSTDGIPESDTRNFLWNCNSFQVPQIIAFLKGSVSKILAGTAPGNRLASALTGLMAGGNFHFDNTPILQQAFDPEKPVPQAWRCFRADPDHRTDSL